MAAVSTRLSIMMFLQFFTWGAWFPTLGQCLGVNKLSDISGDCYGTAPIAAIVAPLFLGLIADRFFASQNVMGVLLLLGGGALLAAPQFLTPGKEHILYWLILAHFLCYMPTLGLGNTIAFANIRDQSEFPKVRVWGTIGWIAAGLTVGFLGWSADARILSLAGACSIVLGVYCFTLPHTPPPAKDQPFDMRTIFMADAFGLLKQPAFFIFILCSTLICIPLAYYYGNTAQYLGQVGFKQPAPTMTLGQMSEIVFMLLVPLFFRRLGVKGMILVGMAAWAIRYLLFAFGAPDQVIWMILVAVVLHGICYDFFFVTGFMYTDRKAPADIRGQVQSMLVFFTQGIGMFFGFMLADRRFKAEVKQGYDALNAAIEAALGKQEPIGYVDSLKQIVEVARPVGVDPALVAESMSNWKDFWLLPAAMAAAVLVLFAVAFRDRSADDMAAESGPGSTQ
ncbi:MAG TPA: MFS transporter [Lacipirellulaceae bacterium]|nr:MFS transporter [Lacipirellulaceae bacterium]